MSAIAEIAVKERPILFSGAMVAAVIAGRKTQTRRVVKEPSWAHPGDSEMELDGSGKLVCICAQTGCFAEIPRLYGVPGDRLWVRETCKYGGYSGQGLITGKAYGQWDGWGVGPQKHPGPFWDFREKYSDKWCPAIHMPRWASRLTLEITEVRVQRLQEISKEDARAEGAEAADSGLECTECDWIGFECSRGVQESGQIDDPFLLCPKCDEVCAHPPIDEQYRFGFRQLWDSINAKRGHGWEKNPWVWAVSFRRLP